jgi:hypothetical protein
VAVIECFKILIEMASELFVYCKRGYNTVLQVVLENEEYLHKPYNIDKRFK